MRALISVSEKTGIVAFAKGLVSCDVEIISTGGTFKLLKESGLPVTPINEVTGFPEMLDGRVKTLHPKIHGGLLALRENLEHMQTCELHQIGLIDMVVVNLYPFESTVQKPGVPLEEVIENIDIGGPSMLRSAAKNYKSVSVLVNPKHYNLVLEELRTQKAVSVKTNALLAYEAYSHTAKYDAAISAYFQENVIEESNGFPETLVPVLKKVSTLRYGENPHQAAAFYKLDNLCGIPTLNQLHGKELSYNNISDLESALQIVNEFDQPAASIIKHANPCGTAIASVLSDAYQKAYESDPVSAFGSIVGLNREVDLETAKKIAQTFVEVVVAPGFQEEAKAVLMQKPALRLIELSCLQSLGQSLTYKYVDGGFLVQTPDTKHAEQEKWKVVTKKQPSDTLLADLDFAFKVVKHVKSNAILLAKNGQTVGIGAGQMSRVEAVELALKKAGEKGQGCVMASDAFFPFKDSVSLAAKSNVDAIIQPGGSKRDQESIDACDEFGLSMVFTGTRHFKH